MAVVELRNVTKTFDETRYVLQDVSMRLEQGSVVVLMGRSGSGKTTLLNLIAGLERPTSGSVFVDGTDVNALDEEGRTDLRLRRIGIVFQRFHLIPELTLRENVRLPLQLARAPDAGPRTQRLLEFFDLQGRGDDFPSTLSGGELQRAAIARGLANGPAVLLADEPTANLDDANAQVALEALQRVAQELGTAVLIASHDAQARSIGHHVLELRQGRVRATDASPRTEPSGLEPRTPSPSPPMPGTPGSRSAP